MAFRSISDEIITDSRYNKLSDGGQWVFVRLLVKSDDCGVLPYDLFELKGLLNSQARPEYHAALEDLIQEVIQAGFAKIVEWEGKQFFMWKPDTFRRIQAVFVSKRTQSKYLKLKKSKGQTSDDFSIQLEDIWASRIFQKIPENSVSPASSSHKEYRVKSKEQEVESKEQEPENTFDPNAPPSQDSIMRDVREINDRYGGMNDYEARQIRGLLGLHPLRTVSEAVQAYGDVSKKVTVDRLKKFLKGDKSEVFVKHNEIHPKHNPGLARAQHTVTPDRVAEITRQREERHRQRDQSDATRGRDAPAHVGH